MGNEAVKDILSEFDGEKQRYDAFGQSVSDLLSRLLQNAKVEHLPIEHRTKDRQSLAGKLVRPEKVGKYGSLTDITDIAGVRIVAFLQEDVRTICNLIYNNFDVDLENSVNKEQSLDPDRFGYASVHYVVSHNGDRARLPEFSMFNGLRCEIQVRTVLQHSWAAIDWKLRYKSSSEVPMTLRRKLYRISALLETADSEFSALALQVTKIRADYTESILAGKYDVPIDAESVGTYLRINKNVETLVRRAEKAKLPIIRIYVETHGRLASLILALRSGGFTSLKQLNDVLKTDHTRHIENLKQLCGAWTQKGGFEGLSIETMVRAVTIMASPADVADKMIEGSPISIGLGLALKEVVSKKAVE